MVVTPPATMYSTATVDIQTAGDKEQTDTSQQSLQRRIKRVNTKWQAMLEASKHMLLSAQEAHKCFDVEYTGPEPEPQFVPHTAFRTQSMVTVLDADAKTKVRAPTKLT